MLVLLLVSSRFFFIRSYTYHDGWTVSPIVGKSSGMEVLVQGRHGKAVSDLLSSKGMPKKWIEVVDLGGKKK